jgi:hypothetical protein
MAYGAVAPFQTTGITTLSILHKTTVWVYSSALLNGFLHSCGHTHLTVMAFGSSDFTNQTFMSAGKASSGRGKEALVAGLIALLACTCLLAVFPSKVSFMSCCYLPTIIHTDLGTDTSLISVLLIFTTHYICDIF